MTLFVLRLKQLDKLVEMNVFLYTSLHKINIDA